MAIKETPPENAGFASVQEIIQALEAIIPETIRERYLVGSMWDEIQKQEQRAPDETVTIPRIGAVAIKKYMGAYLINIVMQSLLQELALGQAVDPRTHRVVRLSEREIRLLQETIPKIVTFVAGKLRIPVRVDPQNHQLHVQI